MSRLDSEVFLRGLSRSRSSAKEMIEKGVVLVDGKVALKANKEVSKNSKIEITQNEKYVSRGGYKLEHAIKKFHVSVDGRTALDIGSSTGGFTDCLVQAGAKSIVSIDVGNGQFDKELSKNKKISLYEKTDIREFRSDKIFDIIVVDVSFISIEKIFKDIDRFIVSGGDIILLVKPQFEVGKGNLNRQGIVKDTKLYDEVKLKIRQLFTNNKYKVSEFIESPILGGTGNKEFLVNIKKIA